MSGFRRKNKIRQETVQVGSNLGPYVSEVKIPDVSQLETDIDNLDIRVEALENAPPSGGVSEEKVNELIKPTKDRVDALEPKVTSNTNSISSINGSVNAINGNISSINGEITSIKNKLNNLPSGGVSMQEVKNYVDPKFTSLENSLANAKLNIQSRSFSLSQSMSIGSYRTERVSKSSFTNSSGVSLNDFRINIISISNLESSNLIYGGIDSSSFYVYNPSPSSNTLRSIGVTYIQN